MSKTGIHGVVDLHHHLLPGVDDGAADVATAVELARLALADGITTVIATPHTLDGTYDVTRQRARQAHADLVAALAAAAVPLEVRLAAEVHLHEQVPELLAQDPDLSLDGQGRYLLLELPHQGPPPGLPEFLFRLRTAGTTPIIAHPERNLAVRQDPDLTADWLDCGVELQLTAGSLTGAFGAPIRDCALRLLRAGRVAVVATDSHSLHKRPPLVQQACAVISNVLDRDAARLLLVDNPVRIAAGAPTNELVRPAAARRRGLLSTLFR